MRWLFFFAALGVFAQNDDLLEQHASAAAAAMQFGDYARAEQHNRAIVQLRPQMAEAQMNLGLSCYLQRKYQDAIQAFETGLRLKPDLWNAELFLGISRFNLNQVSAALPLFERYTAQRPTDLQGQYYLGLSYLALDRPSAAEKPLLAARGIDGQNIDVLYHLAECYLEQAKHDPEKRDALSKSFRSVLESIAAIDPNSFRLAQLHAGYYEGEGKKAEAIQELERVLEHDPKVRGLHYTLGCLYMEELKYEKAREQFEAELLLSAPYPRTYLQLGHVYVATEHPAEALPLLNKALQFNRDDSGLVWVDMGRAYRLMDRPDQAERAYEKAITMGQRTASVYYQLAIVAKKAGDAEKSREALAMSQRLRSEEKQKKAPDLP